MTLDRPVWQSLHAGWAGRAVRHGNAVRLHRDFGPFAAVDPGGDPADLAPLAEAGDELWLVEPEPLPPPPGFALTRQGQLLQMACAGLAPCPGNVAARVLGDADAPAMQALAALTRPGPFHAHTHRLSDFLGVHDGGRLLAMAGERMQPPGHAEVSGVCTHPDAQGRGLAAALSWQIAARIIAAGRRPFLHVWPHNGHAVALYERLGFAPSGQPWLSLYTKL
jgi:ribosomal protein S18 acetylase RimI-like enzyme